MEKNETFNFGRFRKYFAYDLLRCIKQAGLATVLTGLIPAIMLFCSACIFTASGFKDWYLDINLTTVVATIVFTLYFLFMPIPCYGELTDKRKGSNFLMLPASHTEKYASMAINCLIIFPLAFAALYLGIDALCSTLFPSRFQEGFVAHAILPEGDKEYFSTLIFFLPVFVSAAGLCGSLLFKKRKASKTFITCAVSFIVFIIVLLSIAEKTDADIFSADGAKAWYILQTVLTIGLLAYTYYKTKKIQL